MNVEEVISGLKAWLLFEYPFFGQLIGYITFIKEDSIPTAGINASGQIFYNSKWFEKLEKSEILGVVIHEILHEVFLHPMRVENFDRQLWNIAADLKVNEEILHSMQGINAKISLPKDVIIPTNDQWSGFGITIKHISEKSTEQLYHELKPAIDKLKEKYQGQDLIYKGADGKDQNKDEADAQACEWQARVAHAAKTAQQGQGKVPAGVLRELDSLFNPTISWHTLLRNKFRKMGTERSWKRPHKKFLPWYFMGKQKTEGLKCVAVIDTSGSMGSEDMTKAFSELWGLTQEFKFLEMYVMMCDAEVWSVDKLTHRTKDNLLKIIVKGGGGTDFRPAFNVTHKQLNDNIDTMIFFTDLYGTFPEKAPRYDVMWVTKTKDLKIPFGRRILISD